MQKTRSDEALKMAIKNINTKGLPATQKYSQRHENKGTHKRVSEQTKEILSKVEARIHFVRVCQNQTRDSIQKMSDI